MAPLSARMSTTTISLPRPFIFTKGWLASALMSGPGLPALYGQMRGFGQSYGRPSFRLHRRCWSFHDLLADRAHILRRVEFPGDDPRDLIAGQRLDVETGAAGILEEARIFHGRGERLADRGDALRRHTCRHEERPPHRRDQAEEFEDLAVLRI